MIAAGPRTRAATLALVCVLAPHPAFSDTAPWHSMAVPPAAETVLKQLGLLDGRARATVVVDLIRRIQFAGQDDAALRQALQQLSAVGGDQDPGGMRVPLPLSPRTWTDTILRRQVADASLFIAIVTNADARLMYHGLAGLDVATLRWIETQPELLDAVKGNRDALRAFALFAPAVSVVDGRVVVPGGPDAEQQWSSLLGATPSRPDAFVQRLFAHGAGRTAGLYFVTSGVEPPRRAFILGNHLAPASRDAAFRRLIANFGRCYPVRSTDYPFALRSFDAALLLMEVELTADGAPAGPSDRRFWQEVFGEMRKSAAVAAPVDAAWMIEVLCGALAADRPAVFATILAGNRQFVDAPAAEREDVVAALRSRRAYPALFMALEQAGIRRAGVYAAASRHAAMLGRIPDIGRSLTALRQFQGAIMLALNATLAGTLSPEQGGTLVGSLAALRLDDGRYEGRVAEWLVNEWIPAVHASAPASVSLPAEQVATMALAGPELPARERVHWEGVDYVVDLAGTTRQRLQEVRARQGGATLDTVVALHRIAERLRAPGGGGSVRVEIDGLASGLRSFVAADEYGNEALDVRAVLARASTASEISRAVDFLLAHVLPSWAYAPYVGPAEGGALVGGDGSLRHRLGVRAEGRSRVQQRWTVAVSPAARGVMNGSILGIQAGLASWSLRRLSSDAVPAAPAIDGNDTIPLTLTAALSNPRRLANSARDALASAQVSGAHQIEASANDPARLDELAALGAMSAWQRAVLPWMAAEEPQGIPGQFSAIERARVGGAPIATFDAWGSVAPATGPLRLRMPRPHAYELYMGRDADGIVSGQDVDLMLRITVLLAELKLPAALAAPVLSYAMRDHLDRVRPVHPADIGAFARQAAALSRNEVEDYVAALAAVGPLRLPR